MKEPFNQHEENEPVNLCENCTCKEDGFCEANDVSTGEQIYDCSFFIDKRPTKQDIEEERADYLIQCAKDERSGENI